MTALTRIAILTGALLGQAYALQADADRQRRLRARDAHDADRVLDRARADLTDADAALEAAADLRTAVAALADECANYATADGSEIAARLRELL